MLEYWESRFKNEGAMWKFEPSDSALLTVELFKQNHIQEILIPGVGYGRNAKPFYDEGFDITGIEISQSAINLAKENHLNFPVYQGSVTNMPFDNKYYDGIFCYALIHLLNKFERLRFLNNCVSQLKPGGLMVFTVVSIESDMYGKGKFLSSNRFEIQPGIKVFFYNNSAVEKEFHNFGLTEYRDIDEPVKFVKGYAPLKCKYIVCRKEIF